MRHATELRTKNVDDIKHSITKVKMAADDIMYKWFVNPWSFKLIPPGRSTAVKGEAQNYCFNNG